jgi:excisionase family DNA binding protein
MLEITTAKQEKIALSVRETSQATGLSQPFVRLEINRGNLRAVRPGNSRRVLILKDDLVSYLNKGEKTDEQ